MSISQDYEKYDFRIKLSELPLFMRELYLKGYIPEIKINGYYYNIINDLK
jgi:hypothetical protein